jgi:hypothetical protein
MDIATLQALFPELQFKAAPRFAWSPNTSTIYYHPQTLVDQRDGYHRLLHEIAHAKLGHSYFRYDVELVRLEVEAWHYAKNLAKGFGMRISNKTCNTHLETYRNWLYLRSRCPTCQSAGLQGSELLYACLRCRTTWNVPATQLCQVRRRIATLPTPI